MDPNQNINNPNSTTGVAPAPQTPTASQAGPAGTIPPEQASQPGAPSTAGAQDPKSNSKMILFIVIGILLLIVLGVIYFMATQLNKQNAAPIPTPTQALPTSTSTPTPLSEEDIDTIDLGNPEADLKNIEDDVNQL